MWLKSEFRKDGMDTENMIGFDEEYLSSTSNKILLRQCYEKQMLIQLTFAD